jgi:hypothetical protein
MNKKAKETVEAPAIIWLRAPTFDEDGVQVTSGIDQDGREHPDPVPMSPPVSLGRQRDTLVDTIKRLIAEETFRQAVDAEGFETFEEAEDFDIEDDPMDPKTPYEAVFEPPPPSPVAAPVGDGKPPDAVKVAGGPIPPVPAKPLAEPPKAAERTSSDEKAP